jgi:hypothetical protein
MINVEKFKPVVVAAEQGDAESIAVVRETLRPQPTDSVDDIAEKILYYNRLIFYASMKYKDAPYHKDIDTAFARQIHSLLTTGIPFYILMLIYGFRESAKTTRVKMNESYMNLYLEDMVDYTNVMSADGAGAIQFTMDMFNMFAFSKIDRYFPNVISKDFARGKKESQTMSKFTTTTGVTYSSSSALKTRRGNVQADITEDGEIDVKRPKQLMLDDIENENTIKSYVITQNIRDVINATIDGLDQSKGFTVCTANYLSLRGNVNYLINKYKNNSRAFILPIPIHDGVGEPTWPDKYCKTDEEQRQLAAQGIAKVSIETKRRESDNFNTEFLNNPKRSLVYFEDNVVSKLDESILIGEAGRKEHTPDRQDGLLIMKQPEKNAVYVIATDSAKGNGGDQSSATVFKTSGLRYEEVANFYSSYVSPENFAPIVANLANLFNNALVIPENNYPGNEFIAFLRPIYNNIFRVETGTTEDGQIIYEYGVNTNLKTKPEMFLRAKQLFLDSLVTINSRILYDQICEYPSDDILIVKQKDGSGGHFDILMSAVICLWKAGMISVPVEDRATDAKIRQVVDSVFQESESVR